MARIAYNRDDAAAFDATRRITDEGLTAWREAIGRHLNPSPVTRLLDLGAGTGMWVVALTRWYDGIEVIAVEPSEAMRARCSFPHVLTGDASNIPLDDHSVDAAWPSTIIHHLPDLAAAARELRRVVRPWRHGADPVSVRRPTPRDHAVPFFPEAIRVIDTYPSVADVEAAFAICGFTTTAFEQVPQLTAPSLREAAANLRREAHTPLQLITDDEYAAGLARLRRATETETGPVVDTLDLLVLRQVGPHGAMIPSRSG